jgi:hypothetical protein
MQQSGLRWYWNRLRSMSPWELFYRLRQALIIQLERRRVSAPHSQSEIASVIIDVAYNRFRTESPVLWFDPQSEPSCVVSVKRTYPNGVQACLERAESLLLGHYEIFGHEISSPSGSVAWGRDPIHGRDWPKDFYADLDTRDGTKIGGVKWVWELNRHHHLLSLAKAYLLTRDERYAREVCDQILDWIDDNPPLIGVNWASPLEIAIRLINWTWSLAFIQGSDVLKKDVFSRILTSIVEQVGHVERHQSAYSSANNHLIGEATGLTVVGLAFPDLPKAETWCQKGLSILGAEIDKQIYPDGVPTEQSLSYLLFILEFNILAWELARRNGITQDPRWYDRLDVASTFLASLLKNRGKLPAIGDADDAYVLRLDDHPEASRVHSILASAAAILGRADLKEAAPIWDEKSHWLLGDQGERAFQALEHSTTEPTSRIFPDGGYVVLQSERAHVLWDCGPLGYLSTAAHGHADALSFTLAVDGHSILVDPGTYAYQEGGVWRDYFRSTRAHNTIVVNHRDQSEMHGDFLWGRRARTQIARQFLGEDPAWVMGKHDGYQDIGLLHWRALFLWKPGALVVFDLLDGEGEVAIDQLWHLSKEVDPVIKPHHIEFRSPATRICAITSDEPQLARKVLIGEQDPIQGWISPCYGVKKPAPVLTYSGIVQLPIQLTFTFFWGDMDLKEAQSITSRSLDKLESDVPL